MSLGQAALGFAALLVIVDPIALAPVFAALTRAMTPDAARRTAATGVLVGFALLAAAGVGGHAILRAIDAERALVHLVISAALLVMGLAMLAGRGGLQGYAGAAGRNPAIFPLAVPLIAGPGGMGAMVMLAGRSAGQPGGLVGLYAALALVGALTYAAFRAAGPIARRLGDRGVRLITRILGAALIAGAAKFLYDALRDYGLVGAQGAT